MGRNIITPRDRLMDGGFFTIGIYGSVVPPNLGTLWRSAYTLGANEIFTIDLRYDWQPSDTSKSWQHVPLVHYEDLGDFIKHFPRGASLVGIEKYGSYLASFEHPKSAVYLLGSEDNGMWGNARELCDHIVTIESHVDVPYNVAVAGTIVMWHRRFG